MDKITRMLALYKRLMRGEVIHKLTCTLEFEVTERSFDRDIQDMRLFFSESYSNLDLIYDYEQSGYRLKNLELKREIRSGEGYVLSKLLLDSRPLRTDDQNEFLRIILSQLDPADRERILPVLQHAPEIPPCYTKTAMKLIEDLLFSIERKHRISLQFGKGIPEILCSLYSIEFRARSSYLVAWEIKTSNAVLYPLNDILSYVPDKEPYIQSLREQEKLQKLVVLICNAEFDVYSPYIHKKESANSDNI